MKKYAILILAVLIIFAGCSKYDEKDKVVLDLKPIEKAEVNNNDSNNEQAKKDLSETTETNSDSKDNSNLAGSNSNSNNNSNSSDVIIDDKDIFEIREKMFIAQIEDIYYNIEDFDGKYIKVEGMYSVVEPEGEITESVHFVYRNAPGCCGYDGWAGFLLNFDGVFPNQNDWIQVIGTPEIVKNGMFEDLYLNVISIEVKDERGAEYVNQ